MRRLFAPQQPKRSCLAASVQLVVEIGRAQQDSAFDRRLTGSGDHDKVELKIFEEIAAELRLKRCDAAAFAQRAGLYHPVSRFRHDAVARFVFYEPAIPRPVLRQTVSLYQYRAVDQIQRDRSAGLKMFGRQS